MSRQNICTCVKKNCTRMFPTIAHGFVCYRPYQTFFFLFGKP